MLRHVVMVLGPDRPGIVAAVTSVLVEKGCNLEDTEVAVLRAYSAMMLVVVCPDITADELTAALEDGTEGLGLAVTVYPIATATPDPRPGRNWAVSVYGSDRPGIVFEVTRLLARNGINITGMKTRVRGPAEVPIYTMSLDVVVPEGCDGEEVANSLGDLARSLKVACTMRPVEGSRLADRP